MGRIFIILVAIGAFVIWRRWKTLDSSQQRRDYLYKSLVFGLVLLIIGLAVFGRIDVLGAVFASLLLSIKYLIAFAIRHFPMIANIYGATNGFGMGKKRSLKSHWLEINVDFSNGKISGVVLKGEHANCQLDELQQEQLRSLLEACRDDPKSSYLLQTYMTQRFQHQAGNADFGASSPTNASLSEEDALEILGLEGSPSSADIKLAHKRLMQKIHPDRGGNDFLAAMINRARDRLLDKK